MLKYTEERIWMTYNQLIENTIVPAGMAPDEKSKQYEKVVNYVNSVLPSKLYRFRSVTERSLSALYNDELWFANGSTMNDDFEARLYYDKKELMNWLNSQISDEGGLKVLERLAGMDKMPDEIGQMIPNPIAFFNAVKNMTRDQINKLSSQFVKFIADNLDVEVINATNRVQEMTKFACFTEKINSDMMWGQYAASATGFALEYNFGEQNTVVYHDERDTNFTICCNLFPIIYGNKRMDTTQYAKYLFQVSMLQKVANWKGIIYPQYLLNLVVPCPDEFMATKVAIKKSNDWKQEKEWRMFYTTNNPVWGQERHSRVKQKASAIYLGRKISAINQKIIMDIAKEKNIPVFKMDFKESSETYRLRSYRIL